MDKYGYQKGFALAGIASAGTLAALIPPSAMMVIYCIFTEVSIGKVLIAGIFPGLLTAALFMCTAYLQVWLRPTLAPVSGVNMPWKVKLTAVKAILPLLPVAAVILGGIYLGLFTATEAGATGAFVALLVFIFRTRGKNLLSFTRDAMVGAARTTSMIFIIIVGAFVYSRFLSTTGVMAATSKFMVGLPVSPIVVVILILFILLVLGTFLEAVAILALTMPIFFPIVMDLKVDPVWFGILVVMLIEIGVLTPPLGTNVFVVQAAAKSIGYDITLEEIFGGLLPFFIAYIISVALVLIFPPIALWLPGKMMGQ
jgi:tripartite ATP-independent transporter DctM subunit